MKCMKFSFSTLIRNFLSMLGCLWTVIEMTDYFFNLSAGIKVFVFVVLGCLIVSYISAIKKTRITFSIKNTNTKIEVLFGDIFEMEGVKVIPVNEFFDSEIGISVSNKSLHGMLIEKHFGGRANNFDKAIEKELANFAPQVCRDKLEGKNLYYPIGTSLGIENAKGDIAYLIFALSKTDPTSSKAYADIAIMAEAVLRMLSKARNILNDNTLNVPLIGGGLSGIGLPARELLHLIILLVLFETRRRRITAKIRIILHDNIFDEINLNEIAKYWEVQ